MKSKKNNLLKLFLVLLFGIVFTTIYGQDSDLTISKDQIIFKAKLLTLTNYGILNPDSLLAGIVKQKSKIVYNDADYIIIEIYHDQDFQIENRKGITYKFLEYEPCKYVIAFSYKLGRFYKIYGFAYSNFYDLYTDISNLTPLFNKNVHTIYDLFCNGDDCRSIIDLNCYLNFYIENKRKNKNKLSCPCNRACEQISYEPLYIH